MKQIILALGFVCLGAQTALADIVIKNQDERNYTLTVYGFFTTPIQIALDSNSEILAGCNKRCAIKLGESTAIPVNQGALVRIRGGVITITGPAVPLQ